MLKNIIHSLTILSFVALAACGEDSAKKKKDRIERARATRKAYWYKKKLSKEVNDNGVKKS